MFLFFFCYRVCKRWNVLTKDPGLWKKVTVQFTPFHQSQNTVAKDFVNLLPPCVTYIKLQFKKQCSRQLTGQLNFEELAVGLQRRCPHLKTLILDYATLSHSFASIINLCTTFLQDVKILMFHRSTFPACPETEEIGADSKIEVLAVSLCNLKHFNKPLFSRMAYLKELCLNDNGLDMIDSWFQDDTSFLNKLHILDLGYTRISIGRIFPVIQNNGYSLKELYLCAADLHDYYLTYNSVFPHLETICLKGCWSVTSQGVISLIQACQCLQNVYVDEKVATDVATMYSFTVANKCKTIVKSILHCSVHQRLCYTDKFL